MVLEIDGDSGFVSGLAVIQNSDSFSRLLLFI